jgi:DNA-binding NarL/FixJ family response regulator
MPPIRVLLADDHALVRAGFRALLQNLGMEVVAEANDGAEALRLIDAHRPDVVLMDIAMPGLNGLEATTRVAQAFPDVRIIILSMHANAEYARRAVRAGAVGYLLKDASTSELEFAIKAVARGEAYLSPAVSKHIVADYAQSVGSQGSSLEHLSPRLREILQLIAEGHSRKDIAQKLNISVKTFDTYRAQLMQQLDLHDVAGLARYAARMGLVPPDE